MPGWGTVVKYPEDEQTRSGGSRLEDPEDLEDLEQTWVN